MGTETDIEIETTSTDTTDDTEDTTVDVPVDEGEAEQENEPDTQEDDTSEEEEAPGDDDHAGDDAESREQEETDEDGDVIISIGDQPINEPEKNEPAPTWLKEMRQAHREAMRENRELKKKLKSFEQPAEPAVKPLRSKPTLEKHDYDTDAYEKDLDAYYAEKLEHEKIKKQKEEQEARQAQAWQEKLSNYETAKKKLKVNDFEEAEHTILDSFSTTQQGIVLQGAEDPALVIYALGKNKQRAKELGKITDPVRFAFAVAKLEKDINVKKSGKTPPPPEKTINGSGSKTGAVDSQLERLRAEAERTGNYTKVAEYKRKRREAQARK